MFISILGQLYSSDHLQCVKRDNRTNADGSLVFLIRLIYAKRNHIEIRFETSTQREWYLKDIAIVLGAVDLDARAPKSETDGYTPLSYTQTAKEIGRLALSAIRR